MAKYGFDGLLFLVASMQDAQLSQFCLCSAFSVQPHSSPGLFYEHFPIDSLSYQDTLASLDFVLFSNLFENISNRISSLKFSDLAVTEFRDGEEIIQQYPRNSPFGIYLRDLYLKYRKINHSDLLNLFNAFKSWIDDDSDVDVSMDTAVVDFDTELQEFNLLFMERNLGNFLDTLVFDLEYHPSAITPESFEILSKLLKKRSILPPRIQSKLHYAIYLSITLFPSLPVSFQLQDSYFHSPSQNSDSIQDLKRVAEYHLDLFFNLYSGAASETDLYMQVYACLNRAMFLCTWDELRQGEISEDDKKMSLDEAVKYLEMGVEKSRDKNLECFLYCLSWLYKVSPAYRTTRTLSALVYTISSLSTTNIEQLKQIVNVKSWMIDDCLKSGMHPKLVVEEIFNFSAMLNSSNEYCLRGVCKSTEAKVWDVYGSKALKTHCVVSVCEMKKEECSEKDRVWAYLEFLDLLNLDNETKNRYIEEINHKFPVSVKKKEQLNSQTSESETKKSEAVLINELNTAHGLESIIIRIELSQLYLDNSNYVSALPHITSTISTSLKHNYKSGYLRGLHQYTKILKNFENFKECLKVYEVLVEELCCGGMDGCGGEEGREVRIEYAECLVTVFLEGGGGDDRGVDGGDGSGKDLFELEVAADCLRDVLDGMDVNNPSEREREQLQSVYKLLIVVYEHLGMEAEVENVRELERKLKKLGKK